MAASPNTSVYFEVEKITGRDVRQGQVFYRVRWKGYPDDPTWEHEDNLECPELIAAFNACKPATAVVASSSCESDGEQVARGLVFEDDVMPAGARDRGYAEPQLALGPGTRRSRGSPKTMLLTTELETSHTATPPMKRKRAAKGSTARKKQTRRSHNKCEVAPEAASTQLPEQCLASGGNPTSDDTNCDKAGTDAVQGPSVCAEASAWDAPVFRKSAASENGEKGNRAKTRGRTRRNDGASGIVDVVLPPTPVPQPPVSDESPAARDLVAVGERPQTARERMAQRRAPRAKKEQKVKRPVPRRDTAKAKIAEVAVGAHEVEAKENKMDLARAKMAASSTDSECSVQSVYSRTGVVPRKPLRTLSAEESDAESPVKAKTKKKRKTAPEKADKKPSRKKEDWEEQARREAEALKKFFDEVDSVELQFASPKLE